jgi:hypothetical protein
VGGLRPHPTFPCTRRSPACRRPTGVLTTALTPPIPPLRRPYAPQAAIILPQAPCSCLVPSELAPAVCPLVVCPPSAADQPETAARIANLGHPPSPHAIGPPVIERGLHGVSCLLESLPPREECVQATPASSPPPPADWSTAARCVCGRCLDSRRRFELSRCQDHDAVGVQYGGA